VFSIFSYEIVTFIYGDKWASVAEFFVYLVPFSVLWSIHQVLKGKLVGSSDIKFIAKVDFFKLLIMVGCSALSIERFGVLGVSVGLASGMFVGNFILIKKIVGSNLLCFLKDMAHPFIYMIVSIMMNLFFEGYFAFIVLITLTIYFFWVERSDIKFVVNGLLNKRIR
jgi:O-antigen/teichoic acid export membrane protein